VSTTKTKTNTKPISKDHKLFGEKLRKLRLEKEMTQEELADKCGIDFSYLGQIERGLKNFSYATLVKLRKGLRVEDL